LLSSSRADISPAASSWAGNDCRSILVHAYQSPSLASITRRKLCEDGWVIHPEMQKRLLDTSPIFFRDMVATFLEDNGRGYWETSEETLSICRSYTEVGDCISRVYELLADPPCALQPLCREITSL
jgi:hypothetical protein